MVRWIFRIDRGLDEKLIERYVEYQEKEDF